MAKYRTALPQLGDQKFLTDGGLETTLIFHEGYDLPCMAAIDMLRKPEDRAWLRRYYERHAALAQRDGYGFIFESASWRASPDWAGPIGWGLEELAEANRDSIALMGEIRDALETPAMPMVLSGCIGPRGDGYDPGEVMSAEEAEAYHAWQVGIFAATKADMVTAITITNTPEAVGIARAAKAVGIPAAISFTVETDGRLPTGQTLGAAIAAVDEATQGWPAYYMINCAHPSHFAAELRSGASWLVRLRGLRANSSKLSHAELDEAPELDEGNPVELGAEYRDLLTINPQITVLGGCCGTDHRHIDEIGAACRVAA
jgi:S-methylmethionine-dependent homocysteine/selenocysteine methylase